MRTSPRSAWRVIALLSSFLWLSSGCGGGEVVATPGLTVTGFSPGSGLPGTIVAITGTGFATVPTDNVVTIGGSAVRVVDGTSTALRVVALRDVASGKIVVDDGTGTTASSSGDWKREGTTALAAPGVVAGSELFVGVGDPPDLAASGVDQGVLVILCQPSDIDPEALASPGNTAREDILEKLADANAFFRDASYDTMSCDFSVTAGWVPLSFTRDFYCWTQADIDAAQAIVDGAQAALDLLLVDPMATPEDIAEAEADLDEAQDDLAQAQNAEGKLQQGDFLFAEALLAAKAEFGAATFDAFNDYLFFVAGGFLRGQNFGTQPGYHAEWTSMGVQFDIDFPVAKGITYAAQGADWGRVAHELAHFFAGGDLYQQGFADGSVVVGTAGPYSMMGNHDSHPLYCGSRMDTHLHYYDETNIKRIEWG